MEFSSTLFINIILLINNIMTKNKVKRLYRSRNERMIAGICGGIAEYFKVDPTLIRLAWIIFVFMGGSGILAYLIAWIIIPER